jgi:AcrR family transcriptional regulator
MMRYPAEHKEETRERIVEAASRRFRRGGSGVGIAELMKALKLTHGGFYRHFKSKDDLFGEALKKAFEESTSRMRRAIESASPGRELRAVIETYLSEEHCADAAHGCPMAALAPELGRQPRAVRMRDGEDRLVAAETRVALSAIALQVGRFSSNFFKPVSMFSQFFSECLRASSVALLSCDSEMIVCGPLLDSSIITVW